MLFNFCCSIDFKPEIVVSGQTLKTVNILSLFGLKLKDDLKWDIHVDYNCSKAKKKTRNLRK